MSPNRIEQLKKSNSNPGGRTPKLFISDKPMAQTAKTPAPKFTDAQFAALSKDQVRAEMLAETLTPAQLEKAAAILQPDSAAAKGPKFEVISTPHGEFRKGTITHRIYELLTLPVAQAMTQPAIVAKLVEEFPETGEKNFTSRVGFHISQFPIKYGATVGRNAAGLVTTNITGWDGTKVLTPEQIAKRDELLKSKADRAAKKAEKLAAGAGAAEAKAKLKAEKEAAKLVKAQEKAAEAQKKAEEKAKAAADKAAAVAKEAADKATAAAKVASAAAVPNAVVSVGKLATPPKKK